VLSGSLFSTRSWRVAVNVQDPNEDVDYTARAEYLADDVVQNYISNRFSGILGQYRFGREQRAVNGLIALLPASEIRGVLDCPTGIGRWLPNLMTLRPERIFAVDVSPTMLKQAKTVPADNVEIQFLEGVAENLPFDDNSFDLVFCHALLKHLPEAAQLKVIEELARITSKYVIVTASVRRGPAGYVRRFRKAKGAVAVSREWIERSMLESGLHVVGSRKAATPIGVEYSYLLRKV
jgi:ubiquinone/menaquinone biosynthesis C-methylase UbiE